MTSFPRENIWVRSNGEVYFVFLIQEDGTARARSNRDLTKVVTLRPEECDMIPKPGSKRGKR